MGIKVASAGPPVDLVVEAPQSPDVCMGKMGLKGPEASLAVMDSFGLDRWLENDTPQWAAAPVSAPPCGGAFEPGLEADLLPFDYSEEGLDLLDDFPLDLVLDDLLGGRKAQAPTQAGLGPPRGHL